MDWMTNASCGCCPSTHAKTRWTATNKPPKAKLLKSKKLLSHESKRDLKAVKGGIGVGEGAVMALSQTALRKDSVGEL
jgi:hypothetical protein